MIRIALVDDHQLIRDGLRRACDAAEDLEVVAEAGTVAEARDAIASARPDVVVLDVRMPDGTGIELATELRQADPTLGIVVLTMDPSEEMLLAALKAGASALVGKDTPRTEVIDAARRAHRSPLTFTARDLDEVLRQQRRDPTPVPQLSAREKEIMALVAEGLAAGAIARQLFISESTIKTHLSRIYSKLGAANRAQAVMRAVKWGLLPSQETR